MTCAANTTTRPGASIDWPHGRRRTVDRPTRLHDDVAELESRAAAADDEIRALRGAVGELSSRLVRIEQTPRPRVVPGQPPRPNPDALERREAALAGPVTALSQALGHARER